MLSIFEIMRFDSYDSLWFWGLVALIWVLVGARVLGVPWDMVAHMRHDPQLARDVEVLVRVASARILAAGQSVVVWGLVAAMLTTLGLLGFYYGYELAQALMLILGPLVLVWVLRIRAARDYVQLRPEGEALYLFLQRHRWRVQTVILVAVVTVSLWGGVQSVVQSTFR